MWEPKEKLSGRMVMVVGMVVGLMVVGVGGRLFDEQTIQEILLKHNSMRKGEPASNMRKVVWNGVLARMASEWAESCQSEHGQPGAPDKPYEHIGQNMNIFSKRQQEYVTSIDAWMDEKSSYDFPSMQCQEGKLCGHYRQLVWAESWEMGCGYAKCDLVTGLNLKYGDVFVCNYGPGGNVAGEKPYKVGVKCSECGEGFTCEEDMCVSTSCVTQSYSTGAPIQQEEEEQFDLPSEFQLK